MCEIYAQFTWCLTNMVIHCEKEKVSKKHGMDWYTTGSLRMEGARELAVGVR